MHKRRGGEGGREREGEKEFKLLEGTHKTRIWSIPVAQLKI